MTHARCIDKAHLFEQIATEFGTYERINDVLHEHTEVSELLHAQTSYIVNSGMSAISTIAGYYKSKGYHIMADKFAYFETKQYVCKFMGKIWDRTTIPECTLLIVDALAAPAIDIEKLHSADSLLVVDNTYPTFMHSTPLDDGADYVVESWTKYVSGSLDQMSGVLGCRNKASHNLTEYFILTGAGATRETMYAVLLGLQSAYLRFQKMECNAKKVIGKCKELSIPYKYPGYGGVIWLTPEEINKGWQFQHIPISDTFGMNYTTWCKWADNVFGKAVRLSVGIEDNMDKVLEDLKWLK